MHPASFPRRSVFILIAASLVSTPSYSRAAPGAAPLELQPFSAQVSRLLDALDYIGAPVTGAVRDELARASVQEDKSEGITRIQQALDPLCLARVAIDPDGGLSTGVMTAAPELVEQGWRVFLVKVANRAGSTAVLEVESPNGRRLHNLPAEEFSSQWIEVGMYGAPPLRPSLSGLAVEYRVLMIHSRVSGERDATLRFRLAQGAQEPVGVRNELAYTFDCRPARVVTLRVADDAGRPTFASFIVKDPLGRIYPSPAQRALPDFVFQHQVYRGDGETLRLPDGAYDIEMSRGPESVVQRRRVVIGPESATLEFRATRWIDPARHGWWSGDHHIHAAGCSHFSRPTEGVRAEEMIRQTIGEDLKIGANLTWGPGFDYQKQFFCGAVDAVSRPPYLLRYDIEVSGFGSHQSGHLCLLRLREQMYPGGRSTTHWPTLGLNTLRWAKRQGAVTGPAHSAAGLNTGSGELPNYIVPPYDGIGANEYIVNVTHELPGPDGKLVPAIDFMSTVNTSYVAELNMWYHTLNAGYRPRISGETDFPCAYDERVGMGRSYVKLDGPPEYDAWCEGIRNGRSYVSEGRSHLMDFQAGGVAVGEAGSELRLKSPGRVRLTANVAARLEDPNDPALLRRSHNRRMSWDLERARISGAREVVVEAVVNGRPVARQAIVADGRIQRVELGVDLARSSWVALRILPASHTNPIFVLVNDRPIRGSRRSVEWCLQGVDQCWSQKKQFIRAEEMDDAIRAYDHARASYRQRLAESEVE